MARLAIELLGGFNVTLDGVPVTGFAADKTRALLAYLAVEQALAHRRSTLASLFWSDDSEQTARHSLTQATYLLRRALVEERDAPHFILATPQTIQFNPASDHWLDAAEFEALLAPCPGHLSATLAECEHCMARHERAVALYRGELFAQVALDDAELFEEWLTLRREQLHRQAVEALQRLATYSAHQGRYQVAIDYLRRQLALEPWREEAHQHLIHLLALAGQRSAALAQYESCRRILEHEFGAEPARETSELYQRVLDQGLAVEDAPGARQALDAHGPRPAPHNIPAPLTPLLGREELLREAQARLTDGGARAPRLLALTGPGGAGKTSVALELARRLLAEQGQLYPDGIYLVRLDELSPTSGAGPAGHEQTNPVLQTLADTLGLSLSGLQSPLRQVTAFLADKAMLLVVDNAEHVVDAVGFVVQLLEQAPRLRVLLTSRIRPGLAGCWALPIGGLETDRMSPGDEGVGAVRERSLPVDDDPASPASQLFLYYARRVRGSWAPDLEELGAVRRICALVEGLPLAIELAAAWTPALSCQEIAAEIEHSLDFLGEAEHVGTRRQASLRLIFLQSWSLLDERERRTLALLALFRGSFGREAAAEIAGATLVVLASLERKSLLHRNAASGLYRLHMIVQQYAYEQLQRDPRLGAREETAAADRHSAFFLSFVAARAGRLLGSEAASALAEIRPNLENIRQAWQWAIAARRFDLLGQALPALAMFWYLSGMYLEGESALAALSSVLTSALAAPAAGDAGAAQLLLAEALTEQARMTHFRGRFAEAFATAGAAVAAARAAEALPLELLGLVRQGCALWRQGRYQEARGMFEEVLGTAHRHGHARLEADCLHYLGNIISEQGDYDTAIPLYNQSLVICASITYPLIEALSLSNLGQCYGECGALLEAFRTDEQALALARAMGFRRAESGTLGALGRLAATVGRIEEAAAYFAQVLQLYREAGDRQGEAVTLVDLGLLHTFAGDPEAAELVCRRSVALTRELGERRMEAYALTNHGHALLALGLLGPAALAYERAVALRREMEMYALTMESLAGLARVRLAEGRRELALAHVEELLAHLAERTLDGVEDPARVYLACYEVLAACADARAATVLAEGRAFLAGRAERIADASMRRSFLERIPSHRALLGR